MGWSHSRRLTVLFPAFQQPPLKIVFEVEEAKVSGFQPLIEEYFKFCESKGATIKIIDESTDAESGEPCAMAISVSGDRNILGAEMQRIIPSLLQNSTRVG